MIATLRTQVFLTQIKKKTGLPDIDGPTIWDIATYMHNDPSTKLLPTGAAAEQMKRDEYLQKEGFRVLNDTK
jgi:hypothetical protein